MEEEPVFVFVEDQLFDLQVLIFSRDENGRPLYQKGLKTAFFSYYVTAIGPKLELKEGEKQDLLDYFTSYFTELRAKFDGCVLLDNDDAFFKNMIPPHNVDTFMAMFEKRNLYFTPDVSPPPMRLNFPFLVGKDEKNLPNDLLEYLSRHITNDFLTTKFEFLHGAPITAVEVITMEERERRIYEANNPPVVEETDQQPEE
jgi:hypothetical protein